MTGAGRPIFLSADQCLALTRGYLVTVNMQHIYEARASRLSANAIFGDAGAHHCLDGRGAAALFERAMPGVKPLVHGNVLLDHWLKRAAGGRLLVIGSSAAAVAKVMARHSLLETVVDERAIHITSTQEAERWADDLARRHLGGWSLIAVALGVPKQELLAQALQNRFVAPIFCLGGSFEILADALPRSPRWIQAVGLEGVWRLLIEPSRKRVDRLARSYAAFLALRLKSPSIPALTGGDWNG